MTLAVELKVAEALGWALVPAFFKTNDLDLFSTVHGGILSTYRIQ